MNVCIIFPKRKWKLMKRNNMDTTLDCRPMEDRRKSIRSKKPTEMNTQSTTSAFIHHPTAPLRTQPGLIMRNGNPFGMDTSSRNRNALLSMNKLSPFAMRMNQFPPPRIPWSFPGSTMLAAGAGAGGGVQPSLSLLCDVAESDQKRVAKEDPRKPETFKKQKTESLLLKDNPVMLERLTSLGGGFPMPKWGGSPKKSKEKLPVAKTPTVRLGAFPMPPLKEGTTRRTPTFASYKSLWRNTELDLRREIFARKLHRGNVEVLQS
jgi:hypothetical protein